MPRHKTFAVEDALDTAIELFAERGYQDTGMGELARRLGLSRSSIYTTFGDKQSLFAQTLQRYTAECRAPGMHALRDDGSPRAALVSAFEWATDAAAPQQRDQGLLVNTALESRSFAPEVARALQGMLLGMEQDFRGAIERARGANEVAGNVDPVQTSRALLGLYLGLCTLVRSDAKEPVLRAVVQQALALLPVHAPERVERSDQGGG
ncbi:MAG: TetR/AcrR family transcriptional regulator [Spirochaetaceae bacterium]|nr:TetR/AcrR family transcriptional regulator [Spirochaetaceae bacterium]